MSIQLLITMEMVSVVEALIPVLPEKWIAIIAFILLTVKVFTNPA